MDKHTAGAGMNRILIVEGNASFRTVLREIFSARFPLVTIGEAADADEALWELAEMPPQIILIDIQVSGKSGFELAQEIKERFGHDLIIMLTGNDVPEYREAARQCGASFFLSEDSTNLEDLVAFFETVFSSLDKGAAPMT